MSVVTATAAEETGTPPSDPLRIRGAVLLVAAVQSVAMGFLAARGSWYADDLDFLVVGHRRGLSLSGLLTPVNDHLAPGLRLTYAVFAHVAPLDYTVTVVWRVLLQATAVLLMGMLLERVLGPRPVVLVGTLLYALSPLLMPSFMSLSSAVNLLSSQVLGLVVVDQSTRWWLHGGRRHLLLAAVSLFGALCFWEKSALIVLTVAALVVGPLRLGGRGATTRRAIRLAAVLAVPLAGFAALYLLVGQRQSGAWPGWPVMLRLAGRATTHVLLPATVGGPWAWSPTVPPYFGLADPPVVAVLLGGAVLALVIGRGLRVDAPTVWPLWAAVAVYVVATVVSVAVGRYAVFGSVFTQHFHYWADLAIPLTVATTLSIAPVTRASGRRRRRRVRGSRALAAVLLAAFVAGTVASDTTFAVLWGRNPTGGFFRTLANDVGQRDGTVNLWDTRMPSDILTVLAENGRLSDVLPLTGLPLTFDSVDSDPLIVDDQGHLHPAQLVGGARAVQTAGSGCGYLVQGRQSLDIPLEHAIGPNEWAARIGYLANPDARVRVTLVDSATGRSAAMFASTAVWPAGLVGMPLISRTTTTADVVRVQGLADDVNLCVGDVVVGRPAEQR